MREFVIATESNSDLLPEYVEKNEICVIPHYYTVEDEEYGGDKVLTSKAFYDEMRAKKRVATMASNPAVILERFTEIAKQGKDIIFISFSSELSSGIQNIINGGNEVMEEYPDMQIKVIDSLSASANEYALIEKAVQLRAQGKSLEETATALEELVPHLCTLLTVEDLDYLQRGGRLSKSSAVIGNLVGLKPILTITEDGKLVAADKVRGRKKSISTLVDMMAERIGDYADKQIKCCVIHGDAAQEAEALAQTVKERFGIKEVEVVMIGPSIGAHSGPGTLGLMFLGEKR